KMRFSVQLLAIAATVLSFNATPREAQIALPASVMAPTLQPVATVDEEAREAATVPREHATEASPLSWLLAAGFLTLVVLRRTRRRPPDWAPPHPTGKARPTAGFFFSCGIGDDRRGNGEASRRCERPRSTRRPRSRRACAT